MKFGRVTKSLQCKIYQGAFRSLAGQIRAIKLDKGISIVTLQTAKYVKSMTKLLSENRKFWKLKAYPTLKK